MNVLTRFAASTVVLALVLTLGACGGDQTGQQQARSAQSQQSAGPQIQVSDAELESFVEASLALEGFRAEMQSRMSQAEGQEEGRKVRQELLQERDSIIQAAGLEGTERYNTIMKAVKANDQLQKRYTALRDEMESDTVQ